VGGLPVRGGIGGGSARAGESARRVRRVAIGVGNGRSVRRGIGI
jgi:hypothetical protein